MANILQVGSTPVTPDTSIQHGRVTPDLSVKNPVNPNAVNRADGQDTGQAGSSTAEGHFSGHFPKREIFLRKWKPFSSEMPL